MRGNERCPRCGARLIREGVERLCLSCGTLSDPADRERAIANIAAETKFLDGKIRRRRASTDELGHQPADGPAVAELIAQFGDLPIEAWDTASHGGSAADPVRWRKSLESVAARVARGEKVVPVEYFVRSATAERPDIPPTDPERWLAWRVDHGLPVSAELGISFWAAETAMAAPWHRHLKGDAE